MKNLFTIIIFLGVQLYGIAQNTSAGEQFTVWNNDAGWSNGSAPGNDVVGGNLIVDGSVTREGDLTIRRTLFSGPMTLRINSGDSLLVDGDFTIGPDAELIVEAGAFLFVDGDFNNNGIFLVFFSIGGDATNEGTIAVTGDYNEGPGASIDNSGSEGFFVVGDSDAPGSGGQTIPSDVLAVQTALPIELKSFDATLTKNEGTELNWVTAKEENFSHFEIQRSINNNDFEVVGTVKGQGESYSDVYYSFTDENVPYGIVRYRLNAVDIDDSFEIFEAIEIKNTFSSELKAFPNPVTDFSKLRIMVPQDLSGKLNKVALYDNAGSLLYSQTNYDPIDGKIEIESIKEGLYILKITHNGLTENLRIFKH